MVTEPQIRDAIKSLTVEEIESLIGTTQRLHDRAFKLANDAKDLSAATANMVAALKIGDKLRGEK